MGENIKFVQGNEVCAEAGIYAGLDFFAGYPSTPSTEIAEQLSVKLPQIVGKFIQMEDEILSMCEIHNKIIRPYLLASLMISVRKAFSSFLIIGM
jgi:pyruvate/2-oxoacid:ferredoxin oxidoreductase alpha subunit